MNNNISGKEVVRFNDIEVLRYFVSDYDESSKIDLKKRLLLYHLAKATVAGRDIYYDQNGRYNLYIRTLFERIWIHFDGDRESVDFKAVESYLYNIWFANGIHHHYGEHKLMPKFGKEFFWNVYEKLREKGCFECMPKPAPNESLLLDIIFNPEVMKKRTVQDGSEDIVKSSSVNFYSDDVTKSEAEAYYAEKRKECPTYNLGLNSRLSKDEKGKLREEVWSCRGKYAEHIAEIVSHLREAMKYSESESQKKSTELLIKYYEEGDLELFDRYSIEWVQDKDFSVDFINGFIETYQDPLGMKGSWEGLVEIYDREASRQTELLAKNAAWFEQHAPIPDEYRKKDPKGVSATVVNIGMLGGDSYPATPIGINLPNADEIRAEYGSKSIRIENIHQAYDDASVRSGLRDAFIKDEKVREMLKKYGQATSRLHTDLHECLGHGSGQLKAGVSADALGQWHSTIEEARADLFGLYFIADPKMVELGLLPDKDAYKAEYYSYLHNGLVMQLVRIEPGHRIEEAHMRNRALIARYILDKSEGRNVLSLEGLDLKVFDYEAIREIIAELLCEIQRIKSEGDAAAAERLIARYAVDVPAELHKELLERYRKLDIAPYKGFVNPKLVLKRDSDGRVCGVYADYSESYSSQMLRYGRTYSAGGAFYVKPTLLSFEGEPSAEVLEQSKSVRKTIVTRMDGVVAANMRDYGLDYKFNFGNTREFLDEIASSIKPSEELAEYFWSRDVRELKLIALRIWAADQINAEKMLSLAYECEGKAELADELAALLFDRIPLAPQIAFNWIGAGYHLPQIVLTTLARAIRRGNIKLNDAEFEYLADYAFDVIELTAEEEYFAPKAALNCLKTMIAISKEKALTLSDKINRLAARDERKEILEVKSDLDFEIEFVYE